MGNPCRCPVCNTFGSSRLNGYCKRHYKQPESGRPEIDDEGDAGYIVRDEFKPGYGILQSDSFFNGEYPTVKSKYGMEKGRY